MTINFIEIILFLIILVFISYLIGLSLRNLIDDRLSKVSLNLPKQNLVVKIDKENNIESYYEDNDKIKNEDLSKKKERLIEEFENNKIDKNNKDNIIFNGYDKNIISNEDYINSINEDIRNKVDYNNHKNINIKSSDYGMTNYAHPNNMSTIDKRLFMLNYPPNMTLQDYINWLWCFVNIEDQLTYVHLRNLNKLKKGIKLYYEEGILPPPSLDHPPLTAEKYFEKLYDENNQIRFTAPLNSSTDALIGFNYGDYGEFSENQRLNGLSGTINTRVTNDYNVLMNAMTPKIRNPTPANILEKK